jgi:hypothetical protein
MSSDATSSQVGQLLLRMQYRELVRHRAPLPDFADVEFRCHSQNGEDGILLYLFSLVGTTNRRVVEICAGDGFECNAANLIINHGWRGLLIDGDSDNITRGRDFYATCRTTWPSPPLLVDAWVTTDNVNRLLVDNRYAGPIDLLSLDLDGNDYWIWKAIDTISPRVVVLEFNAAWGHERSVTIPYDPEFRLDLSKPPYRCGASLAAFTKLARAKGYRLVGVQSFGFNAFFLRNGLAEDLLPERSPRELYENTERLKAWEPGWTAAMEAEGQAWEEV